VWFLFSTRGCGRIARPAFPAPSDFGWVGDQDKLARMRGEIVKLCLTWLFEIRISNTFKPSSSAKADDPVLRGLSDLSPTPVEYWIARFRGR
jgi:hypothetical protein